LFSIGVKLNTYVTDFDRNGLYCTRTNITECPMIQTRTFGKRGNRPASGVTTLPGQATEMRESLPMFRQNLLLDWGKYIAVAVVGFALVAAMPRGGDGPAATSTVAAARPAAPVKCGATLAEFYDVKSGMDYSEVRDIVGCEGELVSQMSIMGSNHGTVRWDSQLTRFGSMSTSFRDGKLVSRSQFNLK
jgi:hypothetical protein